MQEKNSESCGVDITYRAHGFEGSPFDRGEKLWSPIAVGWKDVPVSVILTAELNQSVGESAARSIH